MIHAAALAVLALYPSIALAQYGPGRPLITVTGEAEVRVPPDEAVIRLRAVTLEKDITLAKSKNDAIVKAVLAALGRLRVPAAHVQTSALSIDRKEERRSSEPPLFIGYEVTKPFTIVLKDLTRADDLLTAVIKAGIDRVDDFDLRRSDLRKYRDQARALAIKAAREKAVALTGTIGQTIGKAFTIAEEAPWTSWSRSWNSSAAMQNSMAEHPGSGATEGTFAAGQDGISARVTVSFELQ